VWYRLNLSWIGFFVGMGALNLYVAFNFSTDAWVNFKLFGGMGLMLVFVVLQALFLARHIEEKVEDKGTK
jgi:intracellular septation protein